MQITRFKTQYLPTTILIVVGVLLWVLSCGDMATAGTYADSAHGDPVSGVDRSTATCENWPGGICSIGDCAHCHDTFDDSICGVNPLMLFEVDDPDSQTDNFCFQCHKGSGSVQEGAGGIINYTYSTNFGGGTPTFTTIYDAFNPTSGDTPSSHNLSDIQALLAGYYGFTTDTNACLTCHHQHLAQQNYPVTYTATGGVQTAIRRIVHNDNAPGNIWGDEDFDTSGYKERMKDLTNNYQAPYYVGGTNYEPANNATADGSNLPNFASFCYDCHQYSTVYSTEREGNLAPIDWVGDDMHGYNHDYGGTYGDKIAPYDTETNYVLSCTDCHEPHGSENEWLLRTCVNGKDNISITSSGWWWDFCTACHDISEGPSGAGWHEDGNNKCSECHIHAAVEDFF